MKKTVITCALSMMVLCGVPSFVGAQTYIPVKEMTSQTTSCNTAESTNYYWYLLDDGSYTHPYDNFGVNGGDALIGGGGNGSSIDIWRNNGVLTKCNTWERVSNVVKDGEKVLAFLNTDDCVFNIPNYTKTSNPSAIDAQIHFTIGFRGIGIGSNYPNPMSNTLLYYWPQGGSQYKCYPNGNSVSDANNCAKVSVNYGNNVQSHVGECQNYRLFWCGDGLINSPIGTRYDNRTYTEECDPAAPEWKNGSDGKSCNSSCKIEYEESSCGSLNGTTEYNSNYSSPRITESTSGLCGVGKLVSGSLSYNKTTGKYTWSCKNGSATPVACNAQDLWCGDGTLQSAYEQCDPKDQSQKGWENGTWKTCNSSCKLESIPRTGPVCSSSYNKKTEYTTTSAAWLSTNDKLCDVGTLVSGSLKYSGNPRTFKWSCTNDGLDVDCEAYQQWCGDGVKNGNEVCDPEDITNKTGWGDGCSASCDKATYNPGVCGSKFHKQKTYLPISVDWLTENTQGLCDKGTVINFHKHTSSYVYTWQCNNNGNPSGECRADQEWCGDGIVQGNQGEDCDDGNKNGTSSSSCSATCTKVAGVSCGTKDKGTTYFGAEQKEPWLTTTSAGMCAAGLTVGKPSMVGTHIEWTCSNANGGSITCVAYQDYCGDGELQSSKEECDYNDINETNWGNDGCDTSCKQKNEVVNVCDVENTFHYKLRQGYEYTFWDEFNAKDADRRLFGDPDVTFIEQQDFNRGANPTFKWTNRSSEKKVEKGKTVRIIESTPKYYIQDHPNKRSEDNIYIEYNVQYANSSTAPESRWKTHKECVFYEISRCGDGIIDTDWEGKKADHKAEECDPGSEGTKVLPDGRICNSNCEIEAAPAGQPEIEKTLQDKVPVEKVNQVLKWTVKVTAKGGDVTDFQIQDRLPEALDYVSYKVVSNSDNLTVTGPTGPVKSGSNNIYTWNVKGTLKENHVLTLEVETKVNKMPNSKDDYLNIACVIDDGKIDCDNDEPPVRNGQPEIEKTLQDKVPVEKVNQVLKWTVKVTAKGGDVTDFQIQDRLPEALDYVSYKVVSNSDNLTVTGPTGPVKSGSNNIYTWNVKGTLKENHVLTLEVETKVNKMPNSEDDYLNIACVIDDGKIDCDNDEPPVRNGQPEIEKTLQDKVPVEKVNQVLKWTVKVTAKGGDVTDFQIQDRLPEALDYVSYKVVSNSDNLTVIGPTGPVKSGSNNIYTWNVKGTLKENHVLTLEVETKVNKMPNSEDDYLNIACVIDDGKIDCDDDEPPVTGGKLNIVKTIVGSKEIKNTGDIITWNVKVTAVDGDVTNFTITDKMPSILGYSGSLVLHNPGLTVGTPIVSGNEVSWRVTGTLEKGEYIEIQLTTYAKVMPDKDYKNVACVKYVDENGKETEKCDDEPLPAPDLWIKKYFLNTDGTVTKETKTVKVNDKLTYKITFGNSGTASATITSIKDFLPKNVDYVSSAIYIVKGNRSYQLSGSEVIDSNRKVDGVYVDIYGGITLAPKTEGYIILTGTVKSEYQNNTTNFACIYLNDKKVDCDDVAHKLTDEVMCKRLDITTSSFGKGGGSTNVSCSTDGGKAENIELDCGNGTVITGTNLSVLPGTCSYPSNSSSSSKSYSVQCKVDGKTTSDCKGTVSVQGEGSGPNDPYCTKPSISGSDRVKTVVCETDNGRSGEIKIDCGYGNQVYTSNGKVKSFTSTCDYSNAGNGTYKIRCRVDNRDIRESECSSEVKYTGGGPSGGCHNCDEKVEAIYAHPKCFNVNAGNVSIQAGEILPFYRNIEKIKSDDLMPKGWFDEKDYGYGNKDTYKNLQGTSCSTAGQIALSSMVCHFSIKDGKGNTQASGSYPCLNKSTASNPAIVNAWIDWQRHVYNDNMDSYDPYKGTNYTFRSNVQTISNFGNNAQYFGEYKISLNEIEYLYCDAETNKWTPGPVANSECTSDFALTNPYTVQKTPSGNLRASTERLSKYLYMNGNSVMSDLLNAISTTEYEANPSVDKAMEDFITKYKKLAVNVGNGLKKVPGKSIYFIEGDRIIKNGQYNKPFTFIQTDPNSNITIEGNVTNLNMMILTEGTITFKDNTNNCNPSQKQTRQTVKGIFYAKGGLKRDGVQMNKSVNEYKRCSEGGLTIKGVLIGKGLQSMMDASRSNLNNWFKDKSANTVMNGASVLIEYSPSVFTKSTMPPGAEDFTTALTIYKQ